MINNISEFIAQKWVDKNIISEEDYELYHYGWFVVLSDLWLFIFTLIIGVIFDITLSSIVFFVVFFLIRRFAGGFHAKTELHCQIISLSFLFFSIAAIKYIFINIDNVYLFIIHLICVIVLPLVSPADTPQKPLSLNEKNQFKRIIGCIGVALFIVNCVLLYFNIKFLSTAIICAFVLETILVIFGRLLNCKLAEN